ncbi:MAG: hypothetical protein QCI00_01830 [Candidatus Thermoplasmatota archaeon]|nr:hypothetical protein [Candidatus Thermoplasmatota archaeon]
MNKERKLFLCIIFNSIKIRKFFSAITMVYDEVIRFAKIITEDKKNSREVEIK